MNIATLRPIFKSVLHFASRRWETPIDDDESSFLYPHDGRTDGNSVRPGEFSTEFADLLGLSRVGVTTEIYAGGDEADRMQGRRFSQRMSPTKKLAELNNMNKVKLDSGGKVDLRMITKTTTVKVTYK